MLLARIENYRRKKTSATAGISGEDRLANAGRNRFGFSPTYFAFATDLKRLTGKPEVAF